MTRPDYTFRLKQIEDLLLEAKEVHKQLERSESKIEGKYDFTANKMARGNIFGNFLRGNKISSINSNVDRSQQALLDFHAKLLLFDEKLAAKLTLPSKMSEFSSADGKVSDIAVRTNMRLKEFDVTKSKRSLETVIRRLASEAKKAAYEVEKEQELQKYIDDKNKGKLK